MPPVAFWQPTCSYFITYWKHPVLVQAQIRETGRALEAALASEDFEEAGALQEEHDSAQQQATALADAHGFTQATDFPEGAEQLQSSALPDTAAAEPEQHVSKPMDAADFDMPLSR